ncbi:MAG: hypothetical protein WKG06_07015 [Segetibacter sp.]
MFVGLLIPFVTSTWLNPAGNVCALTGVAEIENVAKTKGILSNIGWQILYKDHT